MEALVRSTAGGVLERFPPQGRLLEANCSWSAYRELLWRLDEHYELGGSLRHPESSR
jgi:hypothetical protein